MSPKKQLLRSLEDLAKQLNIRLRYEKTSARGGLCIHRGKHNIIIDPKSSDDFKIEIIVRSLAAFDLSGFFIPPKLRDLLEAERKE